MNVSLILIVNLLTVFSPVIALYQGLVPVLMVKNEAHVIEKTLQPLVDGGVTSFFILDTGSTDQTVAITHDFFARHSITRYAIVQESFINFAVSRNRALELAQQAFPDAHFLLMIDAEWIMHGVPELIQFCIDHQYDIQDLYLLCIKNGCDDFYTPRLIRAHKGVVFEGGVHEVPNRISTARVPLPVYIERTVSPLGIEATVRRWRRDLSVLISEFIQNPHNPRTLFYLAQTYDCLDDLENARIWYQKRLEIPGWPEETFMASYRLAQVLERLSDQGKAQWQEAHAQYLQTYTLRPTRAEPLVKLAEHYWSSGEYALCYLYAGASLYIPYPQDDFLLINRDYYEYYRYDLFSRAAWYIGNFEHGEIALKKAISQRPEFEHLRSNLVWYESLHQ